MKKPKYIYCIMSNIYFDGGVGYAFLSKEKRDIYLKKLGKGYEDCDLTLDDHLVDIELEKGVE